MSASMAKGMEGPDTKRDVVAEKPAAIWTRRLVLAAFWAVALLLGLPHWTWTTSIPRSTLPLETMNAWSEGQAYRLEYPLFLGLQAPDLQDDQVISLATNLEHLLQQEQISRIHTFRVYATKHVPRNTTDDALTIIVNTASASASPESKLRTWQPILDVQHPIRSEAELLQAATYMATVVLAIFEEENASIWHLLNGTPHARSLPPLSLAPEKKTELDRRTTRAFKYASTYHLTFSLFTPGAAPSVWNIDEAIRNYITPLVMHLSPISNFTIDTQIQLYASFSPSIAGPVFDENKMRWTLKHSDLTGFVNAAEWPLSPSIGSGPTVNFVLYVPSPDKTPLLIEQNDGSNWIIPQWGGVQIHNAPLKDPHTLRLEDLQADMLIFTEQLATLLGIPETPQSLPLRLSSLTRERATSLILSASSTLGALSRLTLKLTSIAIPDTVAQAVEQTLWRLDQACQDLRVGHYQAALEHARVAEAEVEKAFFEPSMVGQVYFPDEHKVAVYVPLLGPMAVPLIMAAVKEFRKLRERKVKTS